MSTTTEKTGVWGVNSHGEEVTIPVLGVTGKFQSGKTLFCLSIAPGGNRTRCYDFELSAAGYRGLGYDYVDVPAEMRKQWGEKEYKPIDMFRWWRQDILAIEPGKYEVIAVDPITDIESGIVDYVTADYASYGFSSSKAFVATGGIFWKAVKEFQKRLLADLASRCEVFAFTSHLRRDWVNGKPTRKEKPGGKVTLMELASLYLWLEREPDEHGKVPAKPNCRMKLKDRVSYTSFDPETMEPVIAPYLPPAFKECTPNQIRSYLAKPADYAKLKPNERVKPDDPPSEIERLELEREIADAKAKAEETALERLQRQAELKAMQGNGNGGQPDNVDQSRTEKQTTKPEPEPEPSAPQPEKCSDEQVVRLVELKDAMELTLPQFQKGIARHTGGSTNPADLTAEQATEIIAKLEAMLAKKQ